jgi:molybdenum cofactor cytidylyltransferase
MVDLAAIILAAGSASRFRAGQAQAKTKLVQPFQGQPMVRRVAAAALLSRARPVIVVTGYEAAEVRLALAGLDLRFVHNADFATGLASSLKAGMAALGPDCLGAVILLADMPQIGAALIDRLIEGYLSRPGTAAVVPVLAGERGNPVLIGRQLFEALGSLAGDQGARRLLAEASLPVLEIACDDPAIAADIDTPAMLATLEQQAHGAEPQKPRTDNEPEGFGEHR